MSVTNPLGSQWRQVPSASFSLSHPPPEPACDAVPILASRDYSRLKAIAQRWRDRDDPAGRMLAEKLGACRVLPPDAVPASVAVLGARLTFAIEDGAPETRILVLPEDDLPDDRTLPVTTPLGAALLGLAAGDGAEVPGPDGRRHDVRLLMVECPRPQPGRGSRGEGQA